MASSSDGGGTVVPVAVFVLKIFYVEKESMESDIITLEYQALREEIVSRIELRSQTIFGVITLAGVLYSFGLSNSAVAFVYPIISLFLAASWAQNDISIKLTGKYIHDEIEPKLPDLKWQTWRAAYTGKSTLVFGLRLTSLSATGVFIITQAVALLIGFARFQAFSTLEWIAGGLSVAFVVITIGLMSEYRKRIKDILS